MSRTQSLAPCDKLFKTPTSLLPQLWENELVCSSRLSYRGPPSTWLLRTGFEGEQEAKDGARLVEVLA